MADSFQLGTLQVMVRKLGTYEVVIKTFEICLGCINESSLIGYYDVHMATRLVVYDSHTYIVTSGGDIASVGLVSAAGFNGFPVFTLYRLRILGRRIMIGHIFPPYNLLIVWFIAPRRSNTRCWRWSAYRYSLKSPRYWVTKTMLSNTGKGLVVRVPSFHRIGEAPPAPLVI